MIKFRMLALAALAAPLFAQVPPGTTVLTFDGFCDGVTMTSNGNYLAGTHDNYDCAGSSTFVAGVVGADFLLQPNLMMTSRANLADNVGLILLACPLNLYLDFTINGWAYYESCDGVSPETLVNKGTFTISTDGVKPLRSGGVASYQTHNASPSAAENGEPAASYPKGTYTISFPGGCDYITVTAKGSRLGGTHNFSACGDSNSVVAGNDSNLPAPIVEGVAGPGAILQDTVLASLDYVVLYYFDWADSIYEAAEVVDSGGLQIVDFGPIRVSHDTTPQIPPGLPPSVRIPNR
jgi:hypothetical protein